jgi:uncharacterized protein YndB with AHSA1/START domain
MRPMEPFTLEAFENAPVRHGLSVTIGSSPEAVFAALAEPTGWAQWFPLARRLAWVSSAIACVGAEREVELTALGTFRERMLAWEPGARIAFTMVASTSPLTARMAEDFRLVPVGRDTRLDWRVAATPTALGRPAMPLFRAITAGLIQRAGGRLDRLLRARA